MGTANAPDMKSIPPWTIGDLTFKVGLLGLESLTDGQGGQVRRHVEEKLAGMPKPGAESGITTKGGILISKGPSMTHVVVGLCMRDGSLFLMWEPLGEDATLAKHDKPRPQEFTGTFPKLTPDELIALGMFTKGE